MGSIAHDLIGIMFALDCLLHFLVNQLRFQGSSSIVHFPSKVVVDTIAGQYQNINKMPLCEWLSGIKSFVAPTMWKQL